MEGLGWVAKRWFRSRWQAAAPIALLVALGTAGATMTIASAHHTAGAYRDHLSRGRAGHVTINPGVNTVEIDEAIRALPGVEHVATTSLFAVTRDDSAPRPRRQLESDAWDVLVHGSGDGAHIATDRLVLTSGRLPTGPRELVLSDTDAVGLAVGDQFSLAFWEAALLEGAFPGDYEAYLDEMVDPVGVETVTLVGTATVPGAILPDAQYPGVRAILSSDLARRYECPLADVAMATVELDELVATYTATPCASSYTYYSLRLAGGDAAVAGTLDSFNRAADALLGPDGSSPSGVTYALFPIETRQERLRVEHAIRPTVTALTALGIAIIATTVLVVGLAAAREFRHIHMVSERWHQLGMSVRMRSLITAFPVLVSVVIGAVVGTAAGVWRDVGALGSVRPMAPGPIREFVSPAVLGTITIVVLTGSVVLLLATRAAHLHSQLAGGERGPSAQNNLMRRPVTHRWFLARSPARARSMRVALSHRTSTSAVAGSGLLGGLMVTTVVFGASMVALLDQPRSYGWPWHVATTINGGYYGPTVQEADTKFGSHPDVAGWSGLVPITDLAIDATAVGAVAALDRSSAVELPILAGELPSADNEIAVGSITARRLGLGVGDSVEVTRRGHPGRRATVTGVVVLPTLRALNADGVSAGTGVLLPESALPDDGSWTIPFLGLELHEPGNSDVVERVAAELRPPPGSTDFVFVYTDPVAPPEVVDARATLGLPVAVAGIFGLATAIGLAAASWTSAHARRHELVILRSLGFTTAQIRSTVRFHALATAAMVATIAVPIGIILGRVLWRAYAGELGVAAEPSSPLGLVMVVALAIVAIGAAGAEHPARRAARNVDRYERERGGT